MAGWISHLNYYSLLLSVKTWVQSCPLIMLPKCAWKFWCTCSGEAEGQSTFERVPFLWKYLAMLPSPGSESVQPAVMVFLCLVFKNIKIHFTEYHDNNIIWSYELQKAMCMCVFSRDIAGNTLLGWEQRSVCHYLFSHSAFFDLKGISQIPVFLQWISQYFTEVGK